MTSVVGPVPLDPPHGASRAADVELGDAGLVCLDHVARAGSSSRGRHRTRSRDSRPPAALDASCTRPVVRAAWDKLRFCTYGWARGARRIEILSGAVSGTAKAPSPPVDVAASVYVQNLCDAGISNDAVDHPVVTSTSRVQTAELPA